ncbi:hypothetical protein AGMMS49959_00850 [Planctomycetales bacterium]|jgi:hypothetical protein|nr:hypothetical protein [Planctomycetota bacterium]GHV18613.1 hypothetical protein AGMMS49959_00850 [Planctomycetales bacterium]
MDETIRMLHEIRQKLTERWDNMTPEEARADREQQLAEMHRRIGKPPRRIIEVEVPV